MPTFEVEYSYQEPKYAVTSVIAANIDEAEAVAIEQLNGTLDEEVPEFTIESIAEVKH